MRVNEQVSGQANGQRASVAILAGGQSRRMGQNKSFVTLEGRPLFEHVVERVSQLGLPVRIITNDPDAYAAYGLPMFPDVLPGKGSLGGLYTALYHSPTARTLCVACDMPFLNVALLKLLLGQPEGCDAIVPLVQARPQSLHAVYDRRCLAPMLDALNADHLKIQRLLETLRVCYVDEARLSALDPDLRSFMNVNTPAELARARALLSTNGA